MNKPIGAMYSQHNYKISKLVKVWKIIVKKVANNI
jgi:hypothetical protein